MMLQLCHLTLMPLVHSHLLLKTITSHLTYTRHMALHTGMKVKVIRETISQVVTKSAPPEGSPPPAANEDNKGGGLLGGLFKR